MLAFIRLLRPLNLLIIAFTMYSILVFYYFSGTIELDSKAHFDYFLLVVSTVLIAGAGNIINDYFDLRADKVNKPDRVIIDLQIKKRWAIVSHWILNLMAFLIALYLSYTYQSFWYLFIHLLSINSLWFYSMYLKRKLLVGNILVAGLTALVPILCGVHLSLAFNIDIPSIQDNQSVYAIYQNKLLNNNNFIWLFSFFAFFSNLSRELLKDVQDQVGDRLLKARTFPIVHGERKSILLASIFLIICPVFFVSLIIYNELNGILQFDILIIFPIYLAIILQLYTSISLLFRKNPNIVRHQTAIKIAMLFGIILPFYWLHLYPIFSYLF